MLNKTSLHYFFPFLLLISLVLCGSHALAKTAEESSLKIETIDWDTLIPEGYDASEKINALKEQLNQFRDNDPEAMMIYGNIQAELDNAPVNTALDGKLIKMPGFVAPLENNNGIINEFLLVPYFGACIHLPPPPMNQTVLIKADKGQGVKSENAKQPVWITGTLRAIEERTDIGAAGYRIEKAKIEIYEEKE